MFFWSIKFSISRWSHVRTKPSPLVFAWRQACRWHSLIFFNFNTFLKLILNLTLSIFLKLTLLAAPIAMARPNVRAAPCMVARQRADVATTRIADRRRGRVCRATDLGAAVTRHSWWRGKDGINSPGGRRGRRALLPANAAAAALIQKLCLRSPPLCLGPCLVAF